MKTLKDWAPALIVMLIIFFSSSVTGKTINQYGLDKEHIQISGHFWLFLILCVAYYKATKSIIYSVILTILYALLDEFHQMYTHLRSPQLFDIKVDALGAIVAGLFLWKLQHLLPKKLKNWLNS